MTIAIDGAGDPNAPTVGHCLYTEVNYRFKLARDMLVKVDLFPPPEPINTEFFELREDGTLIIKRGYAWDGASGPTVQTGSIIWPSAPHDCFYQMFREGLLDVDRYKPQVDLAFKSLCLDAGMWPLRAEWVYMAVDKFGGPATERREPEILRAP